MINKYENITNKKKVLWLCKKILPNNDLNRDTHLGSFGLDDQEKKSNEWSSLSGVRIKEILFLSSHLFLKRQLVCVAIDQDKKN